MPLPSFGFETSGLATSRATQLRESTLLVGSTNKHSNHFPEQPPGARDHDSSLPQCAQQPEITHNTTLADATGGRDDKTQRSLPRTLATKGQSGAGHTFTHLTYLCLQDKDGRKQAEAEHNGSVHNKDNQTHTNGTAGESTPRPAATTRAADPGNPEVATWYQQTIKDNRINLANNGKRRTTEKTNPPTSDDEPKNNNGKAHRALPTKSLPPP